MYRIQKVSFTEGSQNIRHWIRCIQITLIYKLNSAIPVTVQDGTFSLLRTSLTKLKMSIAPDSLNSETYITDISCWHLIKWICQENIFMTSHQRITHIPWIANYNVIHPSKKKIQYNDQCFSPTKFPASQSCSQISNACNQNAIMTESIRLLRQQLAQIKAQKKP